MIFNYLNYKIVHVKKHFDANEDKNCQIIITNITIIIIIVIIITTLIIVMIVKNNVVVMKEAITTGSYAPC